ncbi:extracellular solute-binding protein [Vineibacter terrae]|uniref:Extracellular solute-binding protein n=1 Tax=Vineibacter terrae TaxID=2586908 RepID=A0A5C8PNQ8_9HYPH|nr:extracellular solute-binding protein [Vineibacter terrae]TXL76034.1 extracellular solute-binding protein [Vineibacter terrae]
MQRESLNLLLPRGISRRKVFQLLGMSGLAAAMPAGLRPAMAQDKSLALFTWSSWGEAGFATQAKDRLGIDLKSTFYASSDEMMAKLRGGGTKLYDMIVPVQNYVEPAAKAGLIEPLNPAALTNAKEIFEQFSQSPQWRVDGKLYGIPFVWGANAMAFNRKETGELDSLKALFDPKYKGRIAMRDEPEDTLAVAALHLGIKKPYAMEEKELQEVKKLLISQKPLVRAYWKNVADVQNMLASGEAVVAWSFLAVIAPLLKAGVDVGWVWPKEGAVGWSESITAVKGTKKLKLVEEYANFTLSAEYGEFMARTTRYAPASKTAIAKLEPQLVKDLGIDINNVDRLVFKDIPKDKSRWNEVWNEVKAA